MRKDLILSMLVMLGAAGVVFGGGMLAVAHLMDGGGSHAAAAAAVATTHPAETATTDKSGMQSHPDPRGAPLPPPSPDVLAELEAKYNDYLSRKAYDECRAQALKALSITGPNSAAWKLRLANATFMSETLPQQKRYVMAHENYAGALALGLEPSFRELAQNRVCQCLRKLGRWEELVEASAAYLKDHKSTPNAPEVALLHAEGLSVVGKSADAVAELGTLTDGDVPEKVRAQALWQLAQLTLKDSQDQIAETVVLPTESPSTSKQNKAALPANVIKPVHEGPAEEKVASVAKEEKSEAVDLAGVPEAQWQAIQHALERSNFDDAQRQLAPYLAASTGELHSRISMRYAKLMLQVSNDTKAWESKP